MQLRLTPASLLAVTALSALAFAGHSSLSGPSLRDPVPGVERNVRTHNEGVTRGELPPDMVFIKGGTMKFGVPKKEVEDLGDRDNEQFLNTISAMYPEHEAKVEDLLVDQYEVTNLQYKVFLEARGLQPSEHLIKYNWSWFDKGELKEGLPPGKEMHPIRAVSQLESQSCATWLGKRLPTEYEWEYAARLGLKSDQYFPWAGKGWEAWDKTRSANAANSNQGAQGFQPFQVGSFKEDESNELYDICGNISEWTDSPFVPYPGWDALEKKVGSQKRRFRPDFSSEDFVVRGGCCLGQVVSNNLVCRWGSDPKIIMEMVGFRCVMSAVAGLDQLRGAEVRDLSLLKKELKDQVDYAPDAMVGQLIQYLDPDTRLLRGSAYFAFTRIQGVADSEATMIKKSVEEPVLLGFLTTTSAIAKPALPAGSYAVYLKGKGLSTAQKEAQKAREEAEKLAKKEKEGGDEGEGDDEGGEDEEDKGDDEGEGEAETPPPGGGEGEAAEEEELSEEEKQARAEEEALKRDLLKVGAVAQVRPMDILDIPTDRDVFLLKNEGGDFVAWAEAERGEAPMHPSRFAYLSGGGAGPDTAAAGNAALSSKEPNDLLYLQFTVKTRASSRYPQFGLKLEFPPGALEPVEMPALEEATRKHLSSARGK